MKTRLVTLFIAAVLFTACEKDDDPTLSAPQMDTEKPKITLVTPNDSTHAMGGMAMSIVANISDNDELHEYHLSVENVTDPANPNEILHIHKHEHGQNAVIDTSVVISSSHHQDYHITIEASDHNNNTETLVYHKHVHM